jgi:hypothetical protein
MARGDQTFDQGLRQDEQITRLTSQQFFFHRANGTESAVQLAGMGRFKGSLQRVDQTGGGTAAQNTKFHFNS